MGILLLPLCGEVCTVISEARVGFERNFDIVVPTYYAFKFKIVVFALNASVIIYYHITYLLFIQIVFSVCI